MNAPESPIDRLNYVNGQRLEAADYRLEQDYHMRVRRWLNRSLYSWGIGAGLEVLVKSGDPHRVIVREGFALDHFGREIVLTEPQELLVCGVPSVKEGVVFGNYLTIQYAERKVAPFEHSCTVPLAAANTACDLSWGGPTRIRAEPLLSFQDKWPNATSGLIVLAQLELTKTCAVRDVRTSVRKYIGAAKAAHALAVGLEGEKDIDKDNSKTIYFHIKGGRPDAVTLYLRGAPFSTLFYTEVGSHKHDINLPTVLGGGSVSHTHLVKLGQLKTGPAQPADHRHEIVANIDNEGGEGAIETDTSDADDIMLTAPGGVKGGAGGMQVMPAGGHDHAISAGDVTSEPGGGTGGEHLHQVNGQTAETGQTGTATRTGAKYTYVEGLRVLIDGTDQTDAILDQLGWTVPGKEKLGDGTVVHDFVKTGTGPIQLELIVGMGALGEGEHTVELKVAKGGGRIIYNLYVE